MVCQVKLNSLNYLKDKGATDDIRRIIDEDLFDKFNDQLTSLAEEKYGLVTDGAKLFSVNMSEHVDIQRSTYYRDAKYRILRAEPNELLFEKLQTLYNSKSDEPLTTASFEINNTSENVNTTIQEIEGLILWTLI
jgi:hypothetical protein